MPCQQASVGFRLWPAGKAVLRHPGFVSEFDEIARETLRFSQSGKRRLIMTRAEFEADVQRQGYELRESEIKPNEHREAHAHGFDARLFILDGSITLVFGDERRVYGPGNSCNVPAGTMHEEHTEADGVRYLAGRRSAAQAAAAE